MRALRSPLSAVRPIRLTSLPIKFKSPCFNRSTPPSSPEGNTMTELTDDELFTVWDEHYADVVSCDRPPLDYEFFRAIIAADHARQAPAPAEVSRLAELRREVERL